MYLQSLILLWTANNRSKQHNIKVNYAIYIYPNANYVAPWHKKNNKYTVIDTNTFNIINMVKS